MEDEVDRTAARRILDAAIAVIEREGISGATTRAIAEEAKVNIASINYYYRSKDALIKTTMAQAWENGAEDFREYAEGSEGSAMERLESFLLFLIDGVNRFPKLTRAMLEAPAGYVIPGSSPLERLNSFLLKATSRAATELGAAEEGKQVFFAAFLASAVLYPLFIPGALSPGFGISLSSKEERQAFVAHLIQSYCRSIQAD